MIESGSDGRIMPVILSGGAGTRLWPLSRAGRPKQLMAPDGGESLLEQTARRVEDRARFDAADRRRRRRSCRRGRGSARRGRAEPGLLIVEPCGRNTAAAIALAALAAGEDELLLVMPSDHLIADEAAFRAAVDAPCPSPPRAGWSHSGSRPTGPRPATAISGAARCSARACSGPNRFAEKPRPATAEAWLAEGGWDWNAGIFLFRAGAFSPRSASMRRTSSTPRGRRSRPGAATASGCFRIRTISPRAGPAGRHRGDGGKPGGGGAGRDGLVGHRQLGCASRARQARRATAMCLPARCVALDSQAA